MIEPLLSDDALLADIEASMPAPEQLHLWWLGQSGFLAYSGEGAVRVLFDPYLSDTLTKKYAGTEKPHVRMSRRVVDPAMLRDIDFVTSTHAHTDHLDAETLAALREPNPVMLIAPRFEQKLVPERWADERVMYLKGRDSAVFGSTTFRAVPAAHPNLETDANGANRYLGYVVNTGPFTIYHSGDGVVYDGMVDAVKEAAAGAPIDLAILPINGKVGNMNGTDAARLAKAIGAKLVVPCHYHMFEFNTAEPEELFVPECERIGQPYRVLKLGERLTLEART